MIEWRQGLKKKNKEDDGDDEEGSENGPRESQEKGTLLFASCYYTSFGFLSFFKFHFVLVMSKYMSKKIKR